MANEVADVASINTLLQDMTPGAAVVEGWVPTSPEMRVAIEGFFAGMNGHALSRAQEVTHQHVARSARALVPVWAVTERAVLGTWVADRRAAGAGEVSTGVVMSEADPRVSVRISPADLEALPGYDAAIDLREVIGNASRGSSVSLRFIPRGVYGFPVGDIGSICTAEDDVLSGSKSALIYLTALNIPRTSTVYAAAMVAVGLLMGLYNCGNSTTGFAADSEREWDPTFTIPNKAGMAAASGFWTKDRYQEMVIRTINAIALLGYSRVSHGHVYLPAELAVHASQVSSLNTFMKSCPGRVSELIPSDLPLLMHGPTHGMSTVGAYTLWKFWRHSAFANPIMRARDMAFGDQWKSVAITLAAHDMLLSHPMIAPVLARFAKGMAQMRANAAVLEPEPALTSKMAYLLVGREFEPVPPDDRALAISYAALIAACASAEVLPKSFHTAYYVQGARTKYTGGVAFWGSFLTGIDKRMAAMSTNDILKLVTEEKAPVVAAIQAVD